MIININKFGHMVPEKLFTAYMSALSCGGEEQVLQDIHHGGDMGVVVINPKNKNIACFRVNDEYPTEDGGTLCWDLIPVEATIKAYPRLSGYTLRIFND